MSIGETGISGYTLSEDEFNLLGYLDARLFLSSSIGRFTTWDASFATDHPDWHRRVEVQRALADIFQELVIRCPDGAALTELRMLFLGASLGSIATYFHLGALARLGKLDSCRVHILDFLLKPLEATKAGEFTIPPQAEVDMGLADVLPAAQYKRKLRDSAITPGNVTELPFADSTFDVVVAPYIQHHLNYLDKGRACREMVRVTAPQGLCLVGDLTFDYPTFVRWLREHAAEDVPYALESFISLEHHVELMEGTTVLGRREGHFYYAFGARCDQ